MQFETYGGCCLPASDHSSTSVAFLARDPEFHVNHEQRFYEVLQGYRRHTYANYRIISECLCSTRPAGHSTVSCNSLTLNLTLATVDGCKIGCAESCVNVCTDVTKEELDWSSVKFDANV